MRETLSTSSSRRSKHTVFPRRFCESRDCPGKYYPAGKQKVSIPSIKDCSPVKFNDGRKSSNQGYSAGVVYWHDDVIRSTISTERIPTTVSITVWVTRKTSSTKNPRNFRSEVTLVQSADPSSAIFRCRS
ncbi:hypothetical protein RvY_06997-2 [Ramazzottius varieornatus]|uniref:Uncharacterized protein n=1 Tax=Ramazzottius varieornatus TaxID=947166 RepID=A0A1D1V6T8_RAMVA|nr:hypothetical protein RvY_06997-2 [Ramazzottius varieornatus]